MRILCLTWSPSGSRRIHDISKILGAELWNYSVFYKEKVLSPIKYPVQAVMTFIKLIKTRPDAVIIQNPPIFAALTCIAYSKFYKVKVVIDHHLIWSMSGFINNPILKAFIKDVEEFCIQRAYVNTTYADDWERELAKMGAKSTVTMYDFVDDTWIEKADLSIGERFPKNKKIIAMPCGTGHVLEHPDLLIEASKNIDELFIVVTGNLKYLREYVEKARKLDIGNVVFTGFLSDEKYRGLIATCDFVANISSEPYGIPHTVTEGLAAGRPVITSGNPSVRKLLGDDYPLVVPQNDIETIKKIIFLAIEREAEFETKARVLYERLKSKREIQIERLFDLLYGR